MENLDYNGMYEYLYAMKYQEQFPSEDYPDGISNIPEYQYRIVRE